jgi:signal transduction histidine kinase/phage shock protein PspC (stress-responsive transcriptional regulator)
MARLDNGGVFRPRLQRRADGRMVAGVARGLADHLGVDVLAVRLVFVVLAAAGGSGIAMYALFWVFAPLSRETRGTGGSGGPNEARDFAILVALGSAALGVLLLLSAFGVGASQHVVLPLFAIGFGVVMLWRQADDAQRERLRSITGGQRWSRLARGVAGIVLVLGGGGAILAGPAGLRGTASAMIAVIVLGAGLALVSGPWWVRMARDLSAERSARIREQERAEVAAHVHDSVLHTLTLIQRHVESPREVARLARAQERELRGWLYRPAADAAQSLRSSLEEAAAEVEDAHGVTIDVVVVGDCAVDERLAAVVQAAREALVNAAKYAGTSPISAYAEVEPERITVFVRDRGPGFDVEAVPADRLGLRQSVVGRMDRHGGTALIRSGAGGTEVQLEMPRGLP